jgi:hypothetical protein
MVAGQLVFSQVMDQLPMDIFRRCVQRYQGDRWVKQFRCLDQYRCMAFAQLTHRESLRDTQAAWEPSSAKNRGLSPISDERDWQQHVDYIHYNPVKHGFVSRPIDWPYSSLHRFIRDGWFKPDWAAAQPVCSMDLE